MLTRVLTSSDVEAYRVLRLEALTLEPMAFLSSAQDFEKETLESVAVRLQSEPFGKFMVGAFVNQQLVGMVGFLSEVREKIKHKGTIIAVYVTPPHRGKGIAKRLMLEAIRRVKTYPDIKQLNLGVNAAQEAAKKLYDSLGFTVYGLEKHALNVGRHYLDEEHRVLFLTDNT
jgi:ribosomal protein S18 acetylase RimI-like enzyme